MADTLIDLPGGGVTALAVNAPKIKFPFRNNPITPNVYARTTERDFWVAAAYYDATERIAIRHTHTNQLSYSESFDAGIWTKGDATVVADQSANPVDGSTTADFLKETAMTAQHYAYQAATYVAGTYTGQFFLKANGRNWGYIQFFDGTTAERAMFDLANGVVGSITGVAITASSIAALGSGWYLCKITITAVSGTGYLLAGVATDGATVSYAGDVTKGLYVFGGDLKAGGAGPYISTTSSPRTVITPDVDAITNSSLSAANNLDPLAFLCLETDPTPIDPGLAGFSRAYARVPSPQVIPSAKFFNRPQMDDIFSGYVYAVTFDRGITSSLFTTRRQLSSIGALPIPTVAVAGTVSSSGSVPFNLPALVPDVWAASLVQIAGPSGSSSFFTTSNATAIKAACELTTGLTVSVAKTNTAIQINILTGALKTLECTDNNVSIASSTSGITITRLQTSARVEGTSVVSQVDTNAVTQTYIVPDSLRAFSTTAGHGGSAGQKIVFWKADRIVARSIAYTASGNVLTCDANDVPGKDFAADYVAFAPQAVLRYVNGSKVCTTRKTTTFFLPGFTPGITTYADIPTQLVYIDPQSWLNRIVAAAAGWSNIEVGDVGPWMGPILQQEITEVQMDDALDQITP